MFENNKNLSLNFECEHHVPVIVHKILKDLLRLNLLDTKYQKTLKVLDTTPRYTRTNTNGNKGIYEHLVVFHSNYELISTTNKNELNVLTHRSKIYDLDRNIIDFLFCFNHKKYVLNVERLDLKNLDSIFKKHYKKKSIFILNDCIYISKTQSLRGIRLDPIDCKDPTLKSIYNYVSSFHHVNIKTSMYKSFLNDSISKDITAECTGDEKLKSYIYYLIDFKRKSLRKTNYLPKRHSE